MGDQEHTFQLPESSQQVAVGMRNVLGNKRQQSVAPSGIFKTTTSHRSNILVYFQSKKKEVTKVIQLSKGATRLLTKEAEGASERGLQSDTRKLRCCVACLYGPRQSDTSESFAVDLEPHLHASLFLRLLVICG